jgi:hypothetical protein
MKYLDALESELATAGIPARRRARILAELADHLEENAEAELGAPRVLARQFADEIGTRLARRTTALAFGVLAVVGTFLMMMFLTGGRQQGWAGYGHQAGILIDPPWWWAPLQLLCMLTAQIALGAGLLAMLRTYRLGHRATISAADAAIIHRRTAVALIAAAITMADVPLTNQASHLDWSNDRWWHVVAQYGGLAAVVLTLAMLPAVLVAVRLKPHQPGEPADLVGELGLSDPRVTPWRAAVALSALVFVALTLIGLRADDVHDGLIRGLLDAVACMTGFAVAGRYLGLRTTGQTAQ